MKANRLQRDDRFVQCYCFTHKMAVDPPLPRHAIGRQFPSVDERGPKPRFRERNGDIRPSDTSHIVRERGDRLVRYMVFEPVAAWVEGASDPGPSQLTGICFAEIRLFDQIIRRVKEMLDFFWQRVKVGSPDMDRAQQVKVPFPPVTRHKKSLWR